MISSRGKTFVFSLLLLGTAQAALDNPYLEYVTDCPSATISASSAKVSSCEQSIYAAVMDRADCKPVPVSSCECEWFNSWASTCLPHICPSTGLAAVVSSRVTDYCSTTAAGLATASTSPAGTLPTAAKGATQTQGAAAATATKAGGSDGLVVPMSFGLVAGFIGLAAFAL